MTSYKIKDKKLVIEIPLKTKRYNPYMEMYDEDGDGDCGPMDNVVGIIDGSEIGFGHWIDMSYKGKSDQNTSIMYHWMGSHDEFEDFCNKNKISIIKY